MASLLRQVLKQAYQLIKSCYQKAASLANLIGGFVGCILAARRIARLVLLQQFFRLQHFIAKLKKVMLMHYLVHPF